tara:strand:+ start:9 stop:359 length:351 start_codon:yes stop_codon:yes gene_type:complete
MDIQTTSIILIFLILFIFEFVDTNKQNISENFYNNKKHFTNFGISGKYPPNPQCSSCVLEESSVSSPYNRINELGDEKGSLYGKVALNCRQRLLNHTASFVEGRETGRTRQCRKLF